MVRSLSDALKMSPLKALQIVMVFFAVSCASTSVKDLSDLDEGQLQIKKHDFQLYSNEKVEEWIKYFAETDRDRFQEFLARGNYYKELIQTRLEDEELPYLLYYQALIESGFNVNAHSRANAVGPWQFVAGTGKRYDLTIAREIDERRDPIKSTEAATKYLTDLFNVFNSWELALAAYNCGEIRVLRAIMKGKTRDFWKLSEMKLLPPETRNYVPKFLAAAHIGENPSKYGIKIEITESYPDVSSYDVPGGLSLSQIAKALELEVDHIEKLNPSLKYKRIPGWLESYEVYLPPGHEKKVLATIPKLKRNRKWAPIQTTPSIHRVRRGDSLTRIASRNNISVRKLMRLNNLKSSKIRVGQILRLKGTSYSRIAGRKYYFVKQLDTLGKIARRYGLRLSYLKKLNGISGTRIYVGQKVDVTPGVRSFYYRVRRGDNLAKIARLYRTSLKRIMAKNSLKSHRIYVGQVLSI